VTTEAKHKFPVYGQEGKARKMFSTFAQTTLLQKNKIKAVHVAIFFVPFNPMATCDCPTP